MHAEVSMVALATRIVQVLSVGLRLKPSAGQLKASSQPPCLCGQDVVHKLTTFQACRAMETVLLCCDVL